MSALPNAAAQAALVTAWTRAKLLQGLVPVQRMPIRLLSSVVTVDAAGWLAMPAPSTFAASALLTELMPGALENSEALNVTPGNIFAASDGVLTMVLQY